jgi:hypothetical protein
MDVSCLLEICNFPSPLTEVTKKIDEFTKLVIQNKEYLIDSEKPKKIQSLNNNISKKKICNEFLVNYSNYLEYI